MLEYVNLWKPAAKPRVPGYCVAVTLTSFEPQLGVRTEKPTLPLARVRPGVLLESLATYLPPHPASVADFERDLARRNPGIAPKTPLVTRLTGVERVHRMPDDWNASDLAVAAVEKLLQRDADALGDVDLLIFAAASQDMVEPATSHIVAAKLGLAVPVMDVKNACNSVLNAMEVAQALIACGQYRRVLIACGEGPSRAIRTKFRTREQYFLGAPGFTMSDAGSALILRATTADDEQPGGQMPGILSFAAAADSTHWDVGMLPGGGTAFPRDFDRAYFEIDGTRLREAFLALGPQTINEAIARAGITWDDVGLVAVHQVAVAYLEDVRKALELPADRTVVTVAEHGNVAAVTLPLQLDVALNSGRVGAGDYVVLVGLAGGISMGAMVMRL